MKDVLVAQGGVRFQKLTPGDCAAIHRASLRLLARVGVEVHHERARKVLEAAGAAVEGTRVRSETPNILDHRTGLRHPGTLEDVREGARVVNALLATYEAGHPRRACRAAFPGALRRAQGRPEARVLRSLRGHQGGVARHGVEFLY